MEITIAVTGRLIKVSAIMRKVYTFPLPGFSAQAEKVDGLIH
jgi:hypothetical protein